MKRNVMWTAVCTVLLSCFGVQAPLAAQCMACTSSSTCGPSSARGACLASCDGEICACSDTRCRPGITAAPSGVAAQFAARDGAGEPRGDAVAVLVRSCDGSVELLVYWEDGTRLIESRLLREADVRSPAHLALTESG